MNHSALKVKVWGDYACFTRPEMKAERVSYPVMTPSAARGILEAIFWKPEFTWVVRRIDVLNEVRYFSLVRNEVANKMSVRSAQGWEEHGGGYHAEEDRTQRHTLALRDVAYLIHADMELRDHATDDVAKYRDQFRRKVAKGQCFHQPYLGTREFVASFGEPVGSEKPIDFTADLGQVLYDLDYNEDKSGRGTPEFFHCNVNKGVIIPERRAV